MKTETGRLPIFRLHPRLSAKLPWIRLADLPTPVQEAGELAGELGVGRLFVKRDDLSGSTYGGNKVRKLEFLLADALKSGAKEVMTFGAAGSNHALATAIYARQAGLGSISMLLPQPNAEYVKKNLLWSLQAGAELHYNSDIPMTAVSAAIQLVLHLARTGRLPKIIPAGGSSPLGAVGFVNAALELKDQIQAGQAPEPDLVYVALGTMGTAVGLALGLKAAGLKTRVVPVRVVDELFATPAKYAGLFGAVNHLLRVSDPSFPECGLSEEDASIRQEFFGEGYARFTREGLDAVELVQWKTGVHLEGTYTGKAFAALVHDARKGLLKDKKVLFWNTYNSAGHHDGDGRADFRALPRPFHRYFTA